MAWSGWADSSSNPAVRPEPVLSLPKGLSKGLWRRTLIGNPLFLWRVVKQQPALSLSKGLGLLDH